MEVQLHIGIKMNTLNNRRIVLAIDRILTSAKICWIGSVATNMIVDNTAVAPCMELLHTGDG